MLLLAWTAARLGMPAQPPGDSGLAHNQFRKGQALRSDPRLQEHFAREVKRLTKYDCRITAHMRAQDSFRSFRRTF